jgi:hypothetical protein
MAKQYFNRDEVIFAPHPKVSNFKDLTGQRFEKLTVLGFAGTRNNDGKWYCECNCGKIISSCGYSIKSGNTKSCGCFGAELAAKRMLLLKGKGGPKRKDLTGMRFGKLVVLRAKDKLPPYHFGKDLLWGYVIAVLFLSRREKEFFATMRIKSISMGANCSQIWEV